MFYIERVKTVGIFKGKSLVRVSWWNGKQFKSDGTAKGWKTRKPAEKKLSILSKNYIGVNNIKLEIKEK